jgi:DNA phosphorothioation-dependent restriction protein DptH
MKYMADTIVKYVLGETNRHSGMLRFVLPSYPSDLLLKIGLELDDLFRRITDRRVDWEYKIAYRLGKEWENGTSSDQANFERICEEGWYNEDDNLTSLRNTVKDPDCDRLVILLAGYEHIDDRASLRDFFHLNQETVWELCLKKSFTNWVTACLKNYVNPDGSEEDIKQIAEVFKDLYHNALTDMLGVSSYLERLDISDVMTCSDAYHLILSNLSPFKLPCMNGLVGRYRSRKSFSSYIKPAQNFYNYSRFFSPSDRKKTIEKINKFRDEHGDEQLESDTLGSFYSLELLLDALEDYIENRSEAARKQLLSADFIYIHDKILNFKAKKPENGERDKRRGRGVKKLCGLPPEVFLRALWITLGDFKKESQGSLLVAENLSSITLQSTVFRHDFDDEDEGDLEDDNEKAKTFLRKVLGGIDDFFGVQLRDLGDLSKPKVFNVKVNSHLCPGEDSGVSYQRNKRAEPQLKFRVIVTSKEGDSCKREFAWALPQNHQCRLLDALYQWVLESFEECSNAIPVFTMPYIPEIFMADDEENVNRLIGTALETTR